jgi:hypothetical protein
MSNINRNRYIESLAVSLIALWLLLTEDFAAWQNANSFFGVTEGYVWIGSTNAFPYAQIGIIALSACLAYIAYTSFRGYSGGDVSNELLMKAYRASKIELGITLVSALLFIVLAFDADWWWFGAGFYGALISGLANVWVYRQLTTQ